MGEISVPQGADVGLFRGDRRPPLGAGDAVAYSLAIAAVSSTVAFACQLGVFTGISMSTRLVSLSSLTLYAAALTLASAVASSLSGGDARDRFLGRQGRRWVDALVALCATALVGHAVYATASVLSGGRFGASEFSALDWRTRIGFVGIPIAAAILGIAALYVWSGSRAQLSPRVAAERDLAESVGDVVVVPRARLIDPAVACLVIGVAALVASVTSPAFSTAGNVVVGLGVFGFGSGGGSIADRIASVTHGFQLTPIAFTALASVVLVAIRNRVHGRDHTTDLFATAGAIVGAVAVLAAGHDMWRTIAHRGLGTPNDGWGRASGIGFELASGALGAAAVYLNRRRTLDAHVELSVLRSRFDPRAIGICLAAASLGSLDFAIAFVSRAGLALSDVLLLVGQYILPTVGLAFAAVIVVGFSQRDAAGRATRDARANAIDAIASAIAAAALVATVIVIFHVLGHNGPRRFPTTDEQFFSVLDQASTAEKVGYVALALAYATLAVGVLRVVWTERRSPPDEPDDQIPVVDLLP